MRLRDVTRRDFLRQASMALSAVALWRPLRKPSSPSAAATGSSVRGQRELGSETGAKARSAAAIERSGRTLTGHEFATVAAIAAIIVPTDQDPGATEADVAGYVDRKVGQDPTALQDYHAGVIWIDDASARLFGRGRRFVELGHDEQLRLLQVAEETIDMRVRPVYSLPARAWRKVQKTYDDLFGLGGGSRFFRIMREDTFAGFYTNPVSWAMLDYIGPPQPRGYPHYEDCPPGNRR